MHTQSLQSCPALCDPMEPTLLLRPWDFFFARILECVTMPSSRGSSQLRDPVGKKTPQYKQESAVTNPHFSLAGPFTIVPLDNNK